MMLNHRWHCPSPSGSVSCKQKCLWFTHWWWQQYAVGKLFKQGRESWWEDGLHLKLSYFSENNALLCVNLSYTNPNWCTKVCYWNWKNSATKFRGVKPFFKALEICQLDGLRLHPSSSTSPGNVQGGSSLSRKAQTLLSPATWANSSGGNLRCS